VGPAKRPELTSIGSEGSRDHATPGAHYGEYAARAAFWRACAGVSVRLGIDEVDAKLLLSGERRSLGTDPASPVQGLPAGLGSIFLMAPVALENHVGRVGGCENGRMLRSLSAAAIPDSNVRPAAAARR
jgi:hypothetical protein